MDGPIYYDRDEVYGDNRFYMGKAHYYGIPARF